MQGAQRSGDLREARTIGPMPPRPTAVKRMRTCRL
jgi:hypothetical protein